MDSFHYLKQGGLLGLAGKRDLGSKGQGKIHFVELLTVDIDGQPKGMTVPINPLSSIDPIIKGSVTVPSCGIDGSSVKGLASVADSDLRLIPDVSTIHEIPGVLPRRALLFADVYQRGPNGRLQPHPLASRTILRRQIEQLSANGMMMRVKLEPEFYYLTNDGLPWDQGRYADLFPQNQGEDLLMETALDLRAVGIEARWLHSEHGEGQQEIELDFVDIIVAADNFTLFKLIVKRRASQQDVEVTFMPKPFPNRAGSGLHCHLQLWKGNHNLLGAPDGTLTEIGHQFVAGLIEHAPAITAIANPTINSYKRLVPDFEAPIHIAWGYQNRSALIRVPFFTTPENAAIEFRSPDPLSNPYLLLAILMRAGLDGVRRQLKSPEPVTKDLYKLSDQQLVKLHISQLPGTLNEALHELRKDTALHQVLGEEFISRYCQIQSTEWYDYTRSYITDFEWDRYLRR